MPIQLQTLLQSKEYWRQEQSKNEPLQELIKDPARTTKQIKVLDNIVYKIITNKRAFTINSMYIIVPQHLVQKMAKYINIQIEFTPPRHSQPNGTTERFMTTLRTIILTCKSTSYCLTVGQQAQIHHVCLQQPLSLCYYFCTT